MEIVAAIIAVQETSEDESRTCQLTLRSRFNFGGISLNSGHDEKM